MTFRLWRCFKIVLIIIGITIITKVVYNHDLQSRAYRDTAPSKGGTYSMNWKPWPMVMHDMNIFYDLPMQCIRYSSKNHICLDAIHLTNTLSLYLSPLCRLWSKTEYEANLNNLPQEQRSPVFAKPTMFDCSSSWSNDQKGIKMLNEKLAEPWLKHQQQSICI